MLFNSLEFGFFFPIVFIIYWALNSNRKIQNTFLLFTSYFFYGYWDPRFLLLIVISSATDYIVGIQLSKTQIKKNRKILLGISLAVNLGMLGFFKYYNFFVDNFNEAFRFFGASLELSTLNLILPVGISFYTFQTLGYTIDVYKKKIQPSNNLIEFFAFVSFFPQLVAGPIERASKLLTQFNHKRKFDYSMAMDGMIQVAWGLFKKVVLADNLAVITHEVFANPSGFEGGTLLMGAIFFTFQLYFDFSGYSDIAIGLGKLLGFNLSKNFGLPLFAKSVSSFWREWHITLTRWFRDYVYIPLARRKKNNFNKVLSTFVLFFIVGFWHGANWTYVLFGIYSAFFLAFEIFYPIKEKINAPPLIAGLFGFYRIVLNFLKILPGMILFRAGNLKEVFNYFDGMFSVTLFHSPQVDSKYYIFLLAGILLDWIGRKHDYSLEWVSKVRKPYFQWFIIVLIFVIMALYKPANSLDYIYYQF